MATLGGESIGLYPWLVGGGGGGGLPVWPQKVVIGAGGVVDYIIKATDTIIYCDTHANNCTLQLDGSYATGQVFGVKQIKPDGGNFVSIVPTSGAIDGSAHLLLSNNDYQSVLMQFDGTNYFILAGWPPGAGSSPTYAGGSFTITSGGIITSWPVTHGMGFTPQRVTVFASSINTGVALATGYWTDTYTPTQFTMHFNTPLSFSGAVFYFEGFSTTP